MFHSSKDSSPACSRNLCCIMTQIEMFLINASKVRYKNLLINIINVSIYKQTKNDHTILKFWKCYLIEWNGGGGGGYIVEMIKQVIKIRYKNKYHE